MPTSQARLEAALPAALARLREAPEVYAALWCGSAARGEANEWSDLDFHALVTGDRRWRVNFTVDGVPVEVFHNPVEKVRAMFAEPDHATVTMFAQGRAVLSHPDLTALMMEAQSIYRTGPPPRPVTAQERFALLEMVTDARARQSDPHWPLLGIPAAMRAVDLLYAARGWWEVKRERWAGELGAREPAAARELDTVLSNGPTDTRQAALERLTTRVTGDLVYQDGGTEPECVGLEQSA